MHSLLARQLKRAQADSKRFVDAVEASYQQFDDDRAMLERSLELSSQELLAANAELVEASRRLQTSAARGVQELSTPLDLILSYAQSIGRRIAPDDEDATAIRHIEREALRCKSILEALLSRP